MILKPDAYLSETLTVIEADQMVQESFLTHQNIILDVVFIDAVGDFVGEGTITGVVRTIINVKDLDPIVVFSTGERIALNHLTQ